MIVYVYNEDGFDRHGEPKKVDRSVELDEPAGQIRVDYAADNTIVGVEFLDAQRVTVEES